MKKRNLLKRVAALAMSAMMVLGMTATTSAAEPTINATEGTLQIEKLVDGSYNGTTDTGTPIPGVTFNYVNVGGFELTADNHVNGFTITEGLKNLLTTLRPIAGTTNVYDGKAIQEALTEALNTKRTQIEALATGVLGTTGEDGKTDAKTLPVGLYLVVEKSAPDYVTTPSDPFIVSIPTLMTNTDGTQAWNYNVLARPKNVTDDVPPVPDKDVAGDPTADNTVDDDKLDATVGTVLTFTLKTNIKDQFGTLNTLTFNDTMTKGLSLSDAAGNVVDIATVGNALSNYFTVKGLTKTETPVEQVIDATASALTFEAETLGDGSTQLTIDFGNADYVKQNYSKVTVTYCAKINKDAVVRDYETNTFNLEYGDYQNIEGDYVYIYTYAYDLKKTDPNGTALPGAEFQIYPSLEDAKAGKNAIEFIKDPTAANRELTYTAVSNADGLVGFYGLKTGTYWIAETKAPKGPDGYTYTLLKEPIEIVVTESTGNGDANTDINVVNTLGFKLPTTGGMGTVIFTIGGIVLMLGAAVLLVRSNKKSKAN